MSEYIIDLTQKKDRLEIGGGKNAIAHPNLDCRTLPEVDKVWNLEQYPYPYADGFFDEIYGIYVAEHLSFRVYKNKEFQKEIYRLLKPGGKAVFIVPNTKAQIEQISTCKDHQVISYEHIETLLGSQEPDVPPHKMMFSPEFAETVFTELFKVNVIAPMPQVVVKAVTGNFSLYPWCATDMVIELTKLEKPVSPLQLRQVTNEPVKEKKQCFNLGSFCVMIKSNETEDWLNIDIIDDDRTRGKASREGYNFVAHDIRKPMLIKDNTVDFINESHLIEHLTRAEAMIHLKDCLRVLKPTGVIRFGTPDLNKFIKAYQTGGMSLFDKDQPEEYRQQDPSEKFFRMIVSAPPGVIGTNLFEGHKTIYTPEDLANLLYTVGFKAVQQVGYDPKTDMFPDESMYINASKGDDSNLTHSGQRILQAGVQQIAQGIAIGQAADKVMEMVNKPEAKTEKPPFAEPIRTGKIVDLSTQGKNLNDLIKQAETAKTVIDSKNLWNDIPSMQKEFTILQNVAPVKITEVKQQ